MLALPARDENDVRCSPKLAPFRHPLGRQIVEHGRFKDPSGARTHRYGVAEDSAADAV